jgi:MscS family membrane protein
MPYNIISNSILMKTTDNIQDILQIVFLEPNTIYSYCLFFTIILIALIFKRFIAVRVIHYIFKLITRNNNTQEQFNKHLQNPINNIIVLIFVYIAFKQLSYPINWHIDEDNSFIKLILNKGFLLLIISFIIQLFLKTTDYLGIQFKEKASKTKSKLDDQLIPFAIDSVKVIIVILGLFTIVSNVFNVNITAIAAGLGVGGIAIAMASKESLENLFGSFTIFLDRPFTVGDIVNIGTITGSVEKVGFRSTRLRTFDKSLVTVPNKKMVDAEVDNLGLRPVRRAKFNIGLVYETSETQLKNIVKDIQHMIDSHDSTNQEGRVRFMDFGESSLDIMILFYVNSSNWDDFINTRQDINYQIMGIIKKHNSDFAFPSRTIFMKK